MAAVKLSRKTVIAAGLGSAAVAGGAIVYARWGTSAGVDGTGQDEDIDDHETYIARQLASMSLEQKVGQLFMVYAYGATADTDEPGDVEANREHLGADNAAAFIAEHRPGGIIYFNWANNVVDPAQIAALSNGLQDAATTEGGVPLFVAVDQEYGAVTRIGEPATQFPGAMPLGATGDAEAARRAAELAGTELRAMGLNQNFAPDADVNVDPANPVIGVRSFSSDPELTAELVAAQVEGYRSGGVAAAAKHFPGHGDTDVDSHVGLPVIDHDQDEWAEIDAPPFEAAIEAGADMIMSAHLQFPALDDSLTPATLSEPILTGLLRERLGYDGVVATDSLEMEGVRTQYGDERVPVMALLAGADLLLMPPDFALAREAVLDAVASGELSEQRIDESVERLLALKLARGIVQDPYCDPEQAEQIVGATEHREYSRTISDRAVTLLRNDDVLPFDGDTVLVTGWGEATTARLAEELGALGVETTLMTTGEEPDASAIEDAVAAADGVDLVVAVTHGVGAGSPQAELVAALADTGTAVVAAAVGTPYDIARLPGAGAYAATYSATGGSIESLAALLTGRIEAGGRLPVAIPDPDDPETSMFEFGSGLD